MSRPAGIICPLITPLTDAEELDEEATATQLDRLAGRIDGIMLLGITGELALLPASVADRLTEVVLDRADPGLTVMLGIGDAGTRRALHHLRRAAGRVDFVSACSPYYYPVPETALTGALRALWEAVTADVPADVLAAARRVAGAAQATHHGFRLSALKAGVGMLTGGGQRPSAPLPAPTDAELERIKKCLLDLGLRLALPADAKGG